MIHSLNKHFCRRQEKVWKGNEEQPSEEHVTVQEERTSFEHVTVMEDPSFNENMTVKEEMFMRMKEEPENEDEH
jgi:hypothetical protein